MSQIEEYFPRSLLERYGLNMTEAHASAVAAIESVIAQLELLEAPTLLAPVAPGKWSPLEVADHLYRATLLFIDGVEGAARGEVPHHHDKGSVAADGALEAQVPGAAPVPGRSLQEVRNDLRTSTSDLAQAVSAAHEQGAAERVAQVNPYFGELTPLGCLQMAALHARHHRKRHLDPLMGTD